MIALKQTPFHAIHLECGAMMVNFGGWHMPVRYSGDKKEHHAVRQRVGLFDVSHMGEVLVRGPKALALLQHLTCNDVSLLKEGRTQYNVLMSPQGGFIDDLLIYRRGAEDYFVVVNASNQEKDFAWMQEQNQSIGADLSYASADYAQLAIQGPRACDVLAKLTALPVRQLKYYQFTEGELAGVPAIVSRTGYTASDGYEVYFSPDHARTVWQALIESGAEFEILPCGLGARDSLRIEGKMILYGNDVNETTTVLEADLARFVRFEKGEFIGKAALVQQQQAGIARRWVGFEMLDFGIPRHGYPIYQNDQLVSEVTSGILSPTLEKPIGMAYLPTAQATLGHLLEVEIRGKRLKAQVVPTPFYKVARS